MIKPRKKRRNRYQESTRRRIKGYFRASHGFIAVFAGFLFVIILGAGLSWAYHSLLDSPWLKLAEIEITGLKKLGRIEILNTIGLRRGECTLNIRTGLVSERLRKLPIVKEASVRIEQNGKLVANIVEREPVAILRCEDNYLMMDNEAILFSRASGNENHTVPLITGLCDQKLKVGDHVSARVQTQIMELLSAIDHSSSWLSGTAIDECRWNENGFTLIMGERDVPVDIGKDDFEHKLTKLHNVIRALNERQWTEFVTRIDLDYPGKAYLEGSFPISKPAQEHAKQPS